MSKKTDLNQLRGLSGDIWNVAVDEYLQGHLNRRQLIRYAGLIGLSGFEQVAAEEPKLPAMTIPRNRMNHGSRVNCVAFSPDGKTLATGSSDRTAILWDVTDLRKPPPRGTD